MYTPPEPVVGDLDWQQSPWRSLGRTEEVGALGCCKPRVGFDMSMGQMHTLSMGDWRNLN